MNPRIIIASLAVAALTGGIVATSTPREGCGAMCCRRPAGAPVESCMRRNPHTGVPEDFGDLNTMPGTHAVGDGCEPTECVLGEGVKPAGGAE